MTLSDIKTKVYDLTKTNSTSYPAANLLIDLNIAYNRVTSLIFQADGRWEYEDANQSDLPIATTALVSGQQDYALATSHLFIDRVEVKTNGGTYFYKLFPRSVEDPMWGVELLGIDNITTSAPVQYDAIGNSVFLYPIPNYSQAASLKLYFKRAQIDFTSGDLSTGTLVPGFASLYHDLLAYLVARDYVLTNEPNLYQGYANTVKEKEMELAKFYARREKDDPPQLTMRPISFR